MSREEQASAAIRILEAFLAQSDASVDRPEVVAHATLSALAHHWFKQFATPQVIDLLQRSARIRAAEPSRWMTQRRIAISKAATASTPTKRKAIYSALLAILTVNSIAMPEALAEPRSSPKCPHGQHWVRAHHRKAYTRTDGVTFSASDVSAHCHPDPAGYSFWKDKILSGLPNGWRQRSEVAKQWSPDEKERTLEALAVLPPTLYANSLKGIYRLSKSSLDNLNPASGQPGVIALYDQAFQSKQELARVLAHELAHEAYRQLSDDEATSYGKVAQWTVVSTPSGNQIAVPLRENFSEDDGKENPNEDFSNNIEHFLFSPVGLQSKNPDIYRWLQKKYGDSFKLGDGR